MDEASSDAKEECRGGKYPHQYFISDTGRNFNKGGGNACLAPWVETLDELTCTCVFVIQSCGRVSLEVRFALASRFIKGLAYLFDRSLIGIVLVVGIVRIAFLGIVVLLLLGSILA